MANLSMKLRWVLVLIGSLLIATSLAHYHGLLKNVPYASHYSILYVWIIGAALFYIGCFSKWSDSGFSENDGVGHSPQKGSRKKDLVGSADGGGGCDGYGGGDFGGGGGDGGG